MANLLKNPGFNGDWWRKTHTGQEFGEIFSPVDWIAFWKEGGTVPHDPANTDGYGRPEMHVINKEPPFLDPLRVHEGNRALKFFTFFRIHDAGVYQRVTGITPGTQLRASGWAHAWSSGGDDPKSSDGVGKGPFFIRAIDYDRQDGVRNFTFAVGIDPTGGTDPWSDSIVWGEGAHIYNAFAQIPEVVVEAQASAVTVFVRSTVLWRFKHCDAYVDGMVLEAIDAPPPPKPVKLSMSTAEPVQGDTFEVTVEDGPDGVQLAFERGEVFQRELSRTASVVKWRCVATDPGDTLVKAMADGAVLKQLAFSVQQRKETPPETGFVPPREDYARTYVLLPPGAGGEWVQAIVDSGAWNKHHWTIGGSADDAGGGPTQRKVIAVNPQGWPSDLKTFFDAFYPGIDYVSIVAPTPEDLRRILAKM